MQIRITTGSAKNKRLKAPNIEGFRAVQEIAKSSLFSILGDKITDSNCLDLFSGSGNLGIEALSRGAKWCDFVDESSIATKTIQENINNCGFEDKCEVFRNSAVKYLGSASRYYDVIFVDPFYNDTSHKYLVKNLELVLEKKGIIAFFHGKELDIKELIKETEFKIIDERRFGASYFTLLNK